MKANRCQVPFCKNSEDDEFLKFYELPIKNPEVCREWLRRIGNHAISFRQLVHETPTPQKICEMHFPYTCKSGSNSQLTEGSLPSLHLPVPTTRAPKKPRLLPKEENSDESSQQQEITKCPDNRIELHMDNFSEFCRFCYKKGILYDIEKSKYKTEVEFVTIIKSLVPKYKLNSSKLRENICLDCVKLLLTSYLTLNRIKASMTVFDIMLEPLVHKRLPKRSMKVSYPDEIIDMKSVLFDCNLEVSLESKRKYLSEKYYFKQNRVEVPPAILEELKQELDTPSLDLPSTFTVEELREIIGTTNQQTDIIKPPKTELADTSVEQLMSKQSSILGMTFDDHNYNLTKIPTISRADKTSVKILKLDLSKADPATRRLIKLPAPRLLKRLSGVPNLPKLVKKSTIKMAATQMVDTSKESTKQSNTELLRKLLMPQEKPMPKLTRVSGNFSSISKTTEKGAQLTEALKKQVDLAEKDSVKIVIPNSSALKKYGNRIKLLITKGDDDDDDNNDQDLNDVKNDDFLTDESSTDNSLSQNNNDKPKDPDNRRFKCLEVSCGFICDTLEEYATHIRSHKTTKYTKIQIGNRICSECNAVFIGYEEYHRHCETHRKAKRKQEMSEMTFQCAQCGLITTNSIAFKRHMQIKHGPTTECPICHEQIKEVYLHSHVKNHLILKRKKPIMKSCEECDLTFDAVKLFNQHLLDHHPKVCLICDKKCSTIGTLRLHMQWHSTEEFECKFCNRKFSTGAGLSRHLRNRSKNKMCALSKVDRLRMEYQTGKMCQICGKIIKTHFNLHMLSHSTTKRYNCDVCNYGTNDAIQFANHKLKHSGDKPFLCAHCGQSYIQKISFTTHLKQHEISDKPIECRYCAETFHTKYEWLNHTKSHKKLTYAFAPEYKNLPLTKPFRCVLCDITLKSAICLKNHLKSHTNERYKKIDGYFPCNRCDMKFDKLRSVKRHVMTQHVKRPELTCARCNKTFISRHVLKKHMRRHSGERPFQCDLCPSKFRLKSKLYVHRSSVHEDRRPFPCKVCKKAFRNVPALREHARTHTGERLQCEHCDKTFAGNSNRCKHLREVHNIRKVTKV